MSQELMKALLAAQEEMPRVERDSVNPHFQSRFVSLGNLVSTVRPVLNKHGIVFAQFPSTTEDGRPALTTMLMHADSGEEVRATAALMPVKQDPQAQGSAITYMRRYALAAALGIVDQEDDDGNAATAPAEARKRQDADAEAPQAKPDAATKAQKAAITRRCTELKINDTTKAKLLKWAGGEPFTKGKAGKLLDLLKKAESAGDVMKAAGLEPNGVAKDGEPTLEDAVEKQGAEALGLTEHDDG